MHHTFAKKARSFCLLRYKLQHIFVSTLQTYLIIDLFQKLIMKHAESACNCGRHFFCCISCFYERQLTRKYATVLVRMFMSPPLKPSVCSAMYLFFATHDSTTSAQSRNHLNTIHQALDECPQPVDQSQDSARVFELKNRGKHSTVLGLFVIWIPRSRRADYDWG